MQDEGIKKLLDEFMTLLEGPRNQALIKEKWDLPNLAYIEDIGVPRPGATPIIAVPHLSMWAKKMSLSVADLYQNPRTYLKVWLSREIGRFRQIGDDRPLSPRVIILIGTGFELSLFGGRQIYSDTEDPWIDPEPLVNESSDLESIELPDFRTSGLMPLAHRFFEELSELSADSGMEIVFRDWARSPFAVAMHMRGITPFLIDMVDSPEFVTQLVEVVARGAIHYRTERAKFLGIDLDAPEFGNDEVNTPSISPDMYRDLVLPSEKAYASHFGGLRYWHSCGDVTPMISSIREVPNIRIFHVGPVTDLSPAAEVFGDATLDICLDSLDIYRGTPEGTRARIFDILRICHQHGARRFSIRPGILQSFEDIEKDIASIGQWVNQATEAVADFEPSTSQKPERKV